MADIQAKSRLEEIILSKLDERGWDVRGGERTGLDLDIDVTFDGTAGTVRLRNAISVSKGMEASSETDPKLIRVDLGEPRGAPERWALWDRYEFPSGKDTPPYCATIVHEAYGPGWTTVLGGGVSPQQLWCNAFKACDAMLSSAELLAPSRTEEERLNALWRTQRHNFGPQRKKVSLVVYGLLLVVLAFFAYIAATIEVSDELPLPAAAMAYGIVAIPLISISIIFLVPIVRWLRRPKVPLEGASALADTLRTTGAFDAIDLTPFKLRDGVPVVVRTAGYLDEGQAPMAISRVEASASAHGVKLSADACELRWPEGVDDLAKVLPDRWLTIDLTAPAEELAKLPDWHRSARNEDTVRWLLTGDEVDKGAAEDLFRTAAAAWTGTAAPYR